MPRVSLFVFLVTSSRNDNDDDVPQKAVTAWLKGISAAQSRLNASKAKLKRAGEIVMSANFLLEQLLKLTAGYKKLFNKELAASSQCRELVDSYTGVCTAVESMVNSLHDTGKIRIADVNKLQHEILHLRHTSMPGKMYCSLELKIGTVRLVERDECASPT